MRTTSPLALFAVLVACGGDPPVAVEDPEEPGSNPQGLPSVRFSSPVTGGLNRTQFYGAYVDHTAGTGRTDYECRAKTYDGHRGTDILVKDFLVMDSGVTVVAAAAGRVTSISDGAFDRSTQNGAGGFGNSVVLDHGEGVRTIYGHLRQSSLMVGVGDEVASGQPLGLIGSSGNSNWPHLHFEFQIDGAALDPFSGPCSGSTSFWRSQLRYQDTVIVTDADVTDIDPLTLADLLERPSAVDTFTTADPSLSLWVQVLNLQPTPVRVELHGPDGSLVAGFDGRFGGTFSMWYVLQRISIAGVLRDEGTWRLDYHQGGQLTLSRFFVLVPGPTPAPVTGAAGPIGVLTGFGVPLEGPLR